MILKALQELAAENKNFKITTKDLSEREQQTLIEPSFTSFSDNVLISYNLDGFAPVANTASLLRGFSIESANRKFLIAGEIVYSYWMAEVGPAASFPIIDQAGLAHECLEMLRLAQRRAWRTPGIAE